MAQLGQPPTLSEKFKAVFGISVQVAGVVFLGRLILDIGVRSVFRLSLNWRRDWV
ncbi:MAG: hypothetical protein HC875_03955 [Anaerolineales bacterium]|nr:hypothetical protein [Anaerolineales bacterium]